MALLRSVLFVLMLGSISVLSSCSSAGSGNALVMGDYGGTRYVNGKPDRVHKKWKSKSSYTPKNNKVAKRRTDW